MNPVAGLFIALALVLANAFFVASEFALLSLDRSQLETLKRPRLARLVNAILDRLTFYLSSAQFGITLSALLLGFVIEPILVRLLEPGVESLLGMGAAHGVAIGLALTVATAVHLVFGEQIPKIYAIGQPLRTTAALSPAMRVFSLVVGPITSLLNKLAEVVVGLFGLSPSSHRDGVVSVEDLEYVVKTSGEGGTLDPEDVELLTASLRFGTKTAADVFVPRTEVVAVGQSATAAELAELSLATGFSRFPVVAEVPDTDGALNLDSIVGLVHVKSVFEVTPADRDSKSVAQFCSEAFAVPPGVALQSLLGEMRQRHFQMAVVLDEHGGMAGIVTFENIVEKLVGEIIDEYDAEAVPAGSDRSGNVVSGLLRADEVLEATGFEMPDGSYETIAGMVLQELGRIPSVGEIVFTDNWRWEVVELDGNRIAWLRYWPPIGWEGASGRLTSVDRPPSPAQPTRSTP